MRNSLFYLVLRAEGLASGRRPYDESLISPIARIGVTNRGRRTYFQITFMGCQLSWALRIRVIGEIRGFVPLRRIACPIRVADGGKVNRLNSGHVVG